MPVRPHPSAVRHFVAEVERRRAVFEATGQGREWLEENDSEWLAHYLLNQPRSRPRPRYIPIGYYD